MIEVILYNYLKGQEIPVYLERPKTPPSKYYLLEKTSGSALNHIYSSTFAIQSYAPSLFEAAEMNEAIIDYMMDAVTQGDISKVSLNSNYNFTDAATRQYRYQAVFDIVHY